jgi:hypothetical protein
VADVHPGVTTEIKVARNERDEAGHLADFGLRLDELLVRALQRTGAEPPRLVQKLAIRSRGPASRRRRA